MKKIFLLGSLNMDLVIRSPYMPASGETLTGNGFMTNEGGKGANQAVACGKLGGEVYMSGCVGGDEFGARMVENIRRYNVNADCVRTVNTASSGIAVILIIDNDNRIILDAGANACVSKSDVDKLFERAVEGDIFLVQLETPIEIVGYALERARALKLKTVLNPAPYNKAIEPYLGYVDIITPNQTELELFSGEENLNSSCAKLLACGIGEVVVTLGSKGYCYCSSRELSFGECIKVKAVDTTAAGDTFCGALAVELSRGASMEKALKFASVAASLAVTRRGAQVSIPTREEVETYLNND